MALGHRGGETTVRTLPQRHSSEQLLSTIDELTCGVGVGIGDLDGMIALRGPGSFTGLRIGLATLYGLHQATGVPATAISTLEALGRSVASGAVVLALVDAMRGEWFAQSFDGGAPVDPLPEPTLCSVERLGDLQADLWVGFGLDRIDPAPAGARRVEPEALAADLLRALPAGLDWRTERLLDPLYLRPPATTAPASFR